ncbi:MAG: PepSY domain-containing protein [Phycisphaerales bacterium JB043]
MSRRPARAFVNKWSRKLHRHGAIVCALPFLVVIATGIILQLKKDVAWVQPPTQRSDNPGLILTFDEILDAATSVPEASWSSWDDIDRLDVRPSRGIVKVRGKNRWEVQFDASTGEILSSSYRRSDLIEQIHDGSFFHDNAKLWIFLPAGAIVLFLWFTGVYLWILPISAKRSGRKRRAAQST